MDSKWQWKTFILKHTHFWLILTFKMLLKKIISWPELILFHLLPKKLNGLSNGLDQTILLLRELLLSLALKESFSQEVSVLFFGLRKEVLCQDSLSQTSLFLEMRVCTLTSLAYFTSIWTTNFQMKLSWKSWPIPLKSKWNSWQNLYQSNLLEWIPH